MNDIIIYYYKIIFINIINIIYFIIFLISF